MRSLSFSEAIRSERGGVAGDASGWRRELAGLNGGKAVAWEQQGHGQSRAESRWGGEWRRIGGVLLSTKGAWAASVAR